MTNLSGAGSTTANLSGESGQTETAYYGEIIYGQAIYGLQTNIEIQGSVTSVLSGAGGYSG